MSEKAPKSLLILGGAKSGKSSLAQRLAEESTGNLIYLATAQSWDDEMEKRIRRHKADRGPRWSTVEEPFDLVGALKKCDDPENVLLVDCLTLWLSNLLTLQDFSEEKVLEKGQELARIIPQLKSKVIFVANEVGWGIVPENALARLYRDLAGGLNQLLGRVCEQVVFVAAGFPMVLKGPAI